MASSRRRFQVTMLDPRRPARHLQELFDEADHRHIALCIHAEGAPQLDDLLILKVLGDQMPPRVWARWICRQAHRWLLFEEDPRIREAVIHTLITTYTDLEAWRLDDPDELFEIGTRLAVAHWVTAQLLLYERGGLLDFLDAKTTPELLNMAEPMDP